MVTSEFVKLAESLLRARNRSDIPMVVLPHPFEPLPKDDIKALAKEKYEAVARALTDGETVA